MRRSGAGSPIRCLRWRCSTPISRCGSGGGWPGRYWKGSWPTGGHSWPACRCWTCPPTGPARRCAPPLVRSRSSAFAALLGRYSGQDDIAAGTPVANRNLAETEDLIGFFVNALVLRADLSGDPAFTTFLARVRAMTLAAYAHQDLPFEQLVDALASDRDRSRTPLFQVLFNYITNDDEQGRGRSEEHTSELQSP